MRQFQLSLRETHHQPATTTISIQLLSAFSTQHFLKKIAHNLFWSAKIKVKKHKTTHLCTQYYINRMPYLPFVMHSSYFLQAWRNRGKCKNAAICSHPTREALGFESCGCWWPLHPTRNALPTSSPSDDWSNHIRRATYEMSFWVSGLYAYPVTGRRKKTREMKQCKNFPPCSNGRPTRVFFGSS